MVKAITLDGRQPIHLIHDHIAKNWKLSASVIVGNRRLPRWPTSLASNLLRPTPSTDLVVGERTPPPTASLTNHGLGKARQEEPSS